MQSRVRERHQQWDTMLESHLPLVHHTARKLSRTLSSRFEHDELVSFGTLGLMNALEAFDPDRGFAFSTFAIPRIRGAILDAVRAQDRMPRRLRTHERQLTRARARLAAQYHRTPLTREVAAELNVDEASVMRWEREVMESCSASLDEPMADGELSLRDSVASNERSAEEAILEAERRELIARAIQELPPRERQVLALYYFEELKMSDIAQVLGVTTSRVCQCHKAAVERLQRLLTERLSD